MSGYKQYLCDEKTGASRQTIWNRKRQRVADSNSTSSNPERLQEVADNNETSDNDNDHHTEALLSSLLPSSHTVNDNDQVLVSSSNNSEQLMSADEDSLFDIDLETLREIIAPAPEQFTNIDEEDVNINIANSYSNDEEEKENSYEGLFELDDEDDIFSSNAITTAFASAQQQEIPETVSQPIYPGAHITADQSKCLTLAFALRHHLTDVGISDLIQLVDAHLPKPIHISKHLFFQGMRVDKPREIFFCKICKGKLQISEDSKNYVCMEECCEMKNQVVTATTLRKEGNYFLYYSLKDQIVNKLNDPAIYTKIDRNSGEGVVSGDAYQSLKHEGKIGPDDISLQWNTDGGKTFKSSTPDIWPLQVGINELPYKCRRDNIILCGLWFGDKPIMSLFLDPFVEELQDLHNNGFTLSNGKKIKVHCLVSTVDSIARPLLQNINQFNGHFGCSFCLHPGETLHYTDDGKEQKRKWVYAVEQAGISDRSIEQHVTDAGKSLEEGSTVNGVKGVSLLLLIPLFHIIFSFVPDYLHCVLLGVVKRFMKLWLDSCNSKEPWYIGAGEKFKILNERLQKIMPPSEVTRLPRDLNSINNWKAAEFRSFLVYYSAPCLKGILPPKYYRHWLLLVYAINIFLREKISDEDFKSAKEALERFVLTTQILYSKKQMVFNVHLLLHIPRSVKDYGGIWDTATFIYEHFIGVLVHFFHGSQHVPWQIFKNYLRLQKLQELVNENLDFWNPFAEQLINRLCSKFIHKGTHVYCKDDVLPLGSSEEVDLTQNEIFAVEKLLSLTLGYQITSIEWKRFLVKGIKLTTSSYERAQKREDLIAGKKSDRHGPERANPKRNFFFVMN